MEIRAFELSMRSRIPAAVNRITALKTQLTNARIALEKVTDGLTRTEAGRQAEMIFVEESYEVEKTRVKSHKRDLAIGAIRSSSY